MVEAWLWERVKKGFEPLMVHCVRIENAVSSGLPDVNCCYNGKDFWIELKIVREGRVQLRSSQTAWITARSGFGGRVVLLAKSDEDLIMYRGIDVFNLAMSNGYIEKVKPWARFYKPWNWLAIRDKILSYDPVAKYYSEINKT